MKEDKVLVDLYRILREIKLCSQQFKNFLTEHEKNINVSKFVDKYDELETRKKGIEYISEFKSQGDYSNPYAIILLMNNLCDVIYDELKIIDEMKLTLSGDLAKKTFKLEKYIISRLLKIKKLTLKIIKNS